MYNFIYENKTKVFFGRGCVKEFLTCLIKDYNTILIGYGQGSVKKNGIYDEVLGILMREGKTVVEFPGIMPNPTYQKVLEGVKLVRDHQVEMILGIGGGHGLLQSGGSGGPIQGGCLGKFLGEERDR